MVPYTGGLFRLAATLVAIFAVLTVAWAFWEQGGVASNNVAPFDSVPGDRPAQE